MNLQNDYLGSLLANRKVDFEEIY